MIKHGCVLAGLILLLTAATAHAQWALPARDVSVPRAAMGPPCGTGCNQLPGAYGVDVALDTAGNAVATWVRRDETDVMRLQAAFRAAGGDWSAPQTVGTAAAIGPGDPYTDVAMADSGRAIVVWQVAGPSVMAAERAPGAAGFGSPFGLSETSTGFGERPRIAMSPAGHAVAVWDGLGTTRQVEGRSWAPGGPVGPIEVLSGPSSIPQEPHVAVNAAGAAAVAWIRFDGTSTIPEARVRPAGASAFEPLRILANTLAGNNSASPDVAIDPLGRATVIWSRFNASISATQIQSRPLPADGGSGAVPAQLVTPDGRDGRFPQVAVGADGTAVATWADCAEGTATCVIASSSRPAGGAYSTSVPLSATLDASAQHDVVVAPDGTVTALWTDTGFARVLAKRRAAGGAFGPEEALSAHPATRGPLNMAVDGQGNVLAGFTLERTGLQVAQVAPFDAGPPALTGVSVPATAVAGVPVGMSAAAVDRFTGASVEWSFGDGSGGAGGSVAHTYAPGTYTVTATARDGVGRATSSSHTIVVTAPTGGGGTGGGGGGGGGGAPAGPLGRIRSDVSTFWSVNGRRTRILRLLVTEVAAGARVQLRCSGRGCPFARKNAARPRRGRVNALKALGAKRVLRAGNVLEVRITRDRFIGKVVRYQIRAGKLPKSTTLCLPAAGGAAKRRC